jgi:hypothetical protein
MGGSLSSEASASSSSSLGGLKDMQDIPLYIEANSVANSVVAASPSGNVQDGVKKIEAISMTWTKWGLIAAYALYNSSRLILTDFSIFLMAFTTSLEGQVVSTLSVFATSSFNAHSLISTVLVVQGVNGRSFQCFGPREC